MNPARLARTALALALCACGGAELPRDDPPPGMGVPQRKLGGLGFTEGPLWDAGGDRLLFSALDEPLTSCAGRILAFHEPDRLETLAEPSCNANGLAFAPDGALLCAEHGSRSVTRREPDGTRSALVEAHGGLPFNAPNDLAVRSDGTVYFTDPTFIGPAPPLVGFEGLWRVPPGAREAVLDAAPDGPNGLALAPDERTLYVSQMRRGRVLAFDVEPSGALSGERVLASGAPFADGMAIDREGNLYVATASGEGGAILVLAPDGARLGAIALPEPARNCAFGGADGRTLYVTAGGSLWSVRAPRPGALRAPRAVEDRPR